jgi:hypothetical protein
MLTVSNICEYCIYHLICQSVTKKIYFPFSHEYNYIGLFYYTLGNISPQYRSQLKAIQLLAVAKRPIIKKHGINCMLETFMEELAKLEQVYYCFSF